MSGKEVLAVNRENKGRRVPAAWLAAGAFCLIGLQAFASGAAERTEGLSRETGTLGGAMLRELADAVGKAVYDAYMPSLAYSSGKGHGTLWILQEQIDSVLPFYGYLKKEMGQERSAIRLEELMQAEAEEDGPWEEEENPAPAEIPTYQEDPNTESAEGTGNTLQDLLRAENEAAMQMQQDSLSSTFIPHEKQAQVDLAALENYERLIKEFYTVDANTMAGSGQLNVGSLAAKDMTLSKDGEGPQILIYHTHSQEGFADSVPGDSSTNIQAVGERLAKILENTYGYRVLHHTAEYDKDGRDDAYAKALPGVEQILKENPSIQVIIDLHRDQMPEHTRLAMDLDGRPTARFMFFNGISRTKTTGDIAYLYNENLADNLAFSFQMQLKAVEYYPGLTRKIYLKGYRYNMHLRPRSLLIEMGAQNNTLEEALNACDPLAHILDMVLSGK